MLLGRSSGWEYQALESLSFEIYSLVLMPVRLNLWGRFWSYALSSVVARPAALESRNHTGRSESFNNQSEE